ncbi:hypothetical protein HY345_01710 [Candidatus Microgenomates bacterium]|nr:hypothetical protein [Candidatus Microgenomates bacterium]
MAHKKIKSFTEKHFNLIHDLHEKGLRNKKIAEFVECSYSGVIAILRHKTWNDYGEFKKKILERSNQLRALEKISGEVKPNGKVEYQMSNNDLVDILTKINRNIERLADSWEKTPNSDNKSLIGRILAK